MIKKFISISMVSVAISLAVVSCQKDNLVTDVPHNQPTDPNWGKGIPDSIVSDYYFTGKIDSTLYTFQDSIGDYVNLAYEQSFVACDSPVVFYGQGFGMYTMLGTSSLDIKLLNCINDTSNVADKESLLYIGAYPYGSSDLLNTVPGVEITWVDSKGKIWKSLPNSGAKNDDSFVIKTVAPAPNDSIGNMVVFGTMNVHLYNSTDFIRIEGGEFNLQYGVY